MKRVLKRLLVSYLVVAIFVIGFAPGVDAGFSPSQMVAGSGVTSRDYDVQQVRSFLEMKVVTDRLQQLGFTPGEIQARLGELNDQQLHRLALKVDQVKVGGDGGAAIIALLIVVVLVIIILRLLRLV